MVPERGAMPYLAFRLAAMLALASVAPASLARAQSSRSRAGERDRLPAAETNDNRAAAGRLRNGVLTVRLEAREALWYPEERGGAAVSLFAFAESGRRAAIPAPMLRVPLGTQVRATVRNALPVPMRLRGLQDRAAGALDSIVLAPGETRELGFRADVAGTFYYWGRTEAFPANA